MATTKNHNGPTWAEWWHPRNQIVPSFLMIILEVVHWLKANPLPMVSPELNAGPLPELICLLRQALGIFNLLLAGGKICWGLNCRSISNGLFLWFQKWEHLSKQSEYNVLIVSFHHILVSVTVAKVLLRHIAWVAYGSDEKLASRSGRVRHHGRIFFYLFIPIYIFFLELVGWPGDCLLLLHKCFVRILSLPGTFSERCWLPREDTSEWEPWEICGIYLYPNEVWMQR